MINFNLIWHKKWGCHLWKVADIPTETLDLCIIFKFKPKNLHMPIYLLFAFFLYNQLLHTPPRLIFSFAFQQFSGRELVKISLIFTTTPCGHTIMIPYHTIIPNNTRCKMEVSMVY